MKQYVIPRQEFAAQISVILNESGKGQINVGNQRGVIFIKLCKSREDIIKCSIYAFGNVGKS
jgi:hypothetical protein